MCLSGLEVVVVVSCSQYVHKITHRYMYIYIYIQIDEHLYMSVDATCVWLL